MNKTQRSKMYDEFYAHVKNKRAPRGEKLAERLAKKHDMSVYVFDRKLREESIERVAIRKGQKEILDRIISGETAVFIKQELGL